MAKRIVRNYTFNPAGRTITFNRPEFGQNIELSRLLLVTDVTTGSLLYQFMGANATAAGNVLTLATVPAACQAADKLQILYDFPQPESGRLITPDTNVLSDDIFDAGPCGWEELYQAASDWNTQRYMPMTLSPHGKFGRYALRITTANVNANTYGGAASVIKRMTHQAQPGIDNPGIVRSEFWWTFGSDGSLTTNSAAVSAATFAAVGGVNFVTVTVASVSGLSVGSSVVVSGLGGLVNCGGQAIITAINGNQITYPINATPSGAYTSGGTVTWSYDNGSPRSIAFQLDTTRNTGPQSAGARAFFRATWQQSAQAGAAQPGYTGQWFLNQGSGQPYGHAGSLSPLNTADAAAGYFTNFPSNQNKRTLQYLALTMDTTNGVWLGLQANDTYFDLTSLALPTVLAAGDPTYNANDFLGGLNQYVQINNLLQGGKGASWGTASWMEIHRARVSYL